MSRRRGLKPPTSVGPAWPKYSIFSRQGPKVSAGNGMGEVGATGSTGVHSLSSRFQVPVDEVRSQRLLFRQSGQRSVGSSSS